MTSMPTELIKIAMVDDHILLREALAVVINGFENCRVVLQADNGRMFIENLHPGNAPDLVLLDIQMPIMDGFDTAIYLRKKYPDMYILILTVLDSELAMIRLLQSGVRGFLRKDIRPVALEQAIRTTIENGYYYSGNSAGRLVNLIAHGEAKNSQLNSVSLTDKELEFLREASTDSTYKAIAAKMKLSPRTIESYRDILFAKLNVKSRVGLVLYAIKNGVVKPGY
jgi:two-component system, NarL family, invasion response regulator UvrY